MRYRIGFALGFTLIISACGGGSGSSPTDGSSLGATSNSSSSSSGSTTGTGYIAIEAGTLTSGDYDDVLNPHLYQDYINDFIANAWGTVDIPYVDIAAKTEIQITDAEGQPLFGANVVIKTDQADILSLKTPVNGIINIYPFFDEIPESFNISVISADGSSTVDDTITLANLDGHRHQLSMPNLNQAADQLDIALVIDSTASMGDEIEYLQAELTDVVSELKTDQPNLSINLGLINYRDYSDDFTYLDYPFTEDIQQFELDLNNISAEGGGDLPEAMDQGLAAAMNLEWRDDSIKIILLVADAPPHSFFMDDTWSSVVLARQKQVHIVPVAASGIDEDAEFLMRSMAAITNSRYLFLTDDSGVGDEHKGPAVECYVVTRLNSTIKRVFKSLISGIRIEPEVEEIVRTEGNYNAGVCESSEEEQEAIAD